ncbi:ATP-dependent sacrificial sulfur transferase LarE [Clostridium aminobutyricum]|uniref:ATP-dependent sacrificial sulfur transferase LarE n=1 Tax=Clostridium aminobutyricum TaxID=33953 RepID=A0A939D6A8_CLOAM|nr:ATP-dependent sacrificial sulfur transferase LarE [Clostridium aminobutyricum]MBN7772219.1 ATP-dependent sacrificial sulfur transferase LarE [Clostridium aminobutyricum]
MDMYEKLESLKSNIRSLESVAVAFSGGVDSSFLLKVAYDVLGENVVAVTARSSTYPEREYREAVEFAESYGIRHQVIVSEELEVEGFSDNPINRCYLCKNELFTKIKDIAQKANLKNVIEGSNYDDLADFRPGLAAVSELGIASPLREALLTKEEIRVLSKEMGLKTWDKPSFACLSSRFPYGEKITVERLRMIDQAEQFLLDLGFKQVRVRYHGDIARIEIHEKEFAKLLNPEITQIIYTQFQQIGFLYAALDLKGYRTGSMNEGLHNKPGI